MCSCVRRFLDSATVLMFTIMVDFKSDHQDVIEVQTGSLSSRVFTKVSHYCLGMTV